MAVSDPKAPVLIGVGEASGQSLKHALGIEWPSTVDLASAAVKTALEDSGAADRLAASIDCLVHTRLFFDSHLPHQFGSPENPPDAVAQASGLNPASLFYGDIGGDSPQKYVNRFAAHLFEGEYKAVVITGAEAVGAVKRARRNDHEMDWSQTSTREMMDLLSGDPILTSYEVRHGLINMPLSYAIMENARRGRLGMDRDIYAAEMAALWSGLASISMTREHAQFARGWTAGELLQQGHGNYRLNDPYRRWMVAQDAVEVGAAIIMTTAGHAAELGIDDSKLIYLHSGADASVPLISEQMDLSRSPAMDWAFGKALDIAELEVKDIGPMDIYSCFPVAVSLAIDALNLPDRSLDSYSLTGGLTFFGGPGNSYSIHAIAALVQSLRKDGSKPGMISANGGVINKESVGIYAAQPVKGEWSADRVAGPYKIPQDKRLKPGPFISGAAKIRSYTIAYGKISTGGATLWMEDENGLPCFRIACRCAGGC